MKRALLGVLALATTTAGALLVPSPPPARAVAPGLDGRLVVISTPVSSGHRDVVTMDPDGENRVNLTGENQSYIAYWAQPSPDGSKIVYARSSAEQDQIWLMDADGSNKTQLTDGALNDSVPTWSPDGRRIAFARSGNLWTMAADGSDETLLLDADFSVGDPEYSPSGASLSFRQDDQAAGSRIYTMPSGGGTPTARTAYNDKVKRASWSPDGTRLLFWHDSGNVEGLYTMGPTGTDLTLLKAGSSTDLATYAWSPSGEQIVYTSPTSGNEETWVMDADGGNATQITNLGSSVNHLQAAWSVPPATGLTPIDGLVQGVGMAPLQLDGPPGSVFSVSGGILPGGLALSPSGVLSGTPELWGSYAVEVTAQGGQTVVTPYLLTVLDPENPVASIVAPVASSSTFHSTTTASKGFLEWTGHDDTSHIDTFDVRYRRAAWNSSFGAIVTPTSWQDRSDKRLSPSLSRGYTYCYSVRGADKSGRTGAWSGERCTITPLDQTSMRRSSGWTRQSSSRFYGGSAYTTLKRGATLTRTGARLSRVGIVATTCSTCGKVDVYVGSTRIGRISLVSSSTRHRKVKLLPRFSYRSGTVRVKVVTARRTVRIDGLVVGAR